MREHAHLPAVVGFVGKHVAEHLEAHRPGRGQAVSAKLLDAAAIAERFRQHLPAASGAPGQRGAGLFRSAVRTVELLWNHKVRSRKPDPLRADVVHVREDRRNGADFAGRYRRRFCSPGRWIEMLDKELIHAIIGGKDLRCGSARISLRRALHRGHGTVFLDAPSYRRAAEAESPQREFIA
jgi:hypothetical protein